MWMTASVALMIARPFITRPTIYNSAVGAFTATPFISDDIQWVDFHFHSMSLSQFFIKSREIEGLIERKKTIPKLVLLLKLFLTKIIILPLQEVENYVSVLLPIHNISVVFILVMLYSVICCSVAKMSRLSHTNIDRVQIQLFLQALLICASTAIAASLYTVLNFIPAPKYFVITANAVWQFSHGTSFLMAIMD
ncbi:hypothetical protein COOONC_13851 [Cooperia oncophora]